MPCFYCMELFKICVNWQTYLCTQSLCSLESQIVTYTCGPFFMRKTMIQIQKVGENKTDFKEIDFFN